MGRRTLLLGGGFVQTVAMASWLQAEIDQTGSKSPDLSRAMPVVSQIFLEGKDDQRTVNTSVEVYIPAHVFQL